MSRSLMMLVAGGAIAYALVRFFGRRSQQQETGTYTTPEDPQPAGAYGATTEGIASTATVADEESVKGDRPPL